MSFCINWFRVMEILMTEYIDAQIKESLSVLASVYNNKTLLANLYSSANACISAIQNGHKILLAGNGGSASDAQHIAAEFVCRFACDRIGLPAIALTTDSSILTSLGNDYGFEYIFSRQIEALGRKSDVFIAYSTSGKSENIINALRVAKKLDLICIGLTGSSFGPMNGLCDHCMEVPSLHTAKIQEVHALFGHILCGLVESSILKKES